MKFKRIRAKRSIEETDAIGDLTRQFVRHPRLQSRVSMSPNLAAGATVTAWYRGHHAGVHSAYLTLRRSYPEAAEALLYAFDMNHEGSIGRGR